MAAARFVPSGAAQIVIGMAGVIAFWPLASAMWSGGSEQLDDEPRQRSAPVEER